MNGWKQALATLARSGVAGGPPCLWVRGARFRPPPCWSGPATGPRYGNRGGGPGSRPWPLPPASCAGAGTGRPMAHAFAFLPCESWRAWGCLAQPKNAASPRTGFSAPPGGWIRPGPADRRHQAGRARRGATLDPAPVGLAFSEFGLRGFRAECCGGRFSDPPFQRAPPVPVTVFRRARRRAPPYDPVNGRTQTGPTPERAGDSGDGGYDDADRGPDRTAPYVFLFAPFAVCHRLHLSHT